MIYVIQSPQDRWVDYITYDTCHSEADDGAGDDLWTGVTDLFL